MPTNLYIEFKLCKKKQLGELYDTNNICTQINNCRLIKLLIGPIMNDYLYRVIFIFLIK